MEYIILYIIIAISFSITFYLRYALEAFAIVKTFEKVYYDGYSQMGIGHHIGTLIAGTIFFPLAFQYLFEDRETIIKNLAKEFIKLIYKEKEK